MSSQRLKVGVVGIGFAQYAHVPAFRAHERCEVVAICASDRSRAERVAARSHIGSAFGDWRELLSSEVDIVTIAVPPELQPTIAEEAANAGKHLFCEKPLATSLDGARRVVDAVRRAKVAAAVDFELQESAAWLRAREVLPDLGPVRHVDLTWRMRARSSFSLSWKDDPVRGGGAVLGFATHAVYGIEWLVGAISGLMATVRDRERGVELTLALRSGATGAVSIESDDPAGTGHRLRVTCDGGAIVLRSTPDDHGDFELAVDRGSGIRVDVPFAGDGRGRICGVTSLARRFVDRVFDGGEVTPSVLDGLRVQLLIDRIYRAAGTGRSCTVPEDV